MSAGCLESFVRGSPMSDSIRWSNEGRRRLRSATFAVVLACGSSGCRQGPERTTDLAEAEALKAEVDTERPAELATLRIELATPGHAGKKLFLAAAQTPDGWLKATGWTAAKSAVVTPPTTVVEFDSIPALPTAISVFIDVDADEELARGLFGIPTEPWGFSNDLTPFFGAPRFKDAVIDVQAPATVARIRVRGGEGGDRGEAEAIGDDR
ncbi:MAG: hypothetical protein CMJ27_11450 [Phycisphaerae bacterium]|nr:hypothetical protein [Phycisphaerae bacterium]OUX00478.1 MAG: hypothetical protein CBD91_06540 [Phycisphaeraceae bacterium TMED231]